MRNNDSGFTLAETLVATSVAAIVSLLAFAFVAFVAARSRQLTTMSSRDGVHNDLVHYLGSLKTVRETRTRDQIFDSCFQEFAATSRCPGQTEGLGISVFAPGGTQISGPPNDPVRYTVDGTRCSQNINCAIEVSTTVRSQGVPYWVNNVLEVNPGRRFEFVEVRYKIKILQTPDQVVNREITGSMIYDTMDVPVAP